MAARLTVAALCCALAACAGAPPRDGAQAPPAEPSAVTALLETRRLADAAYSQGRHAEAAALYTELVKATPGEVESWYRLGNALVRTGRYDDAAFAYQRTLVAQPSNSRAWHNLGVVRMRQAQEAFASGVKQANEDPRVFEESLRLSAGLYSLIDDRSLPSTEVAPSDTAPPPAADGSR